MKKFEVGKKYEMIFITSDRVVIYEVLKRTEKTITIRALHNGEVKTCRILGGFSERWNSETVKPLGSYSMCPILSSADILEGAC